MSKSNERSRSRGRGDGSTSRTRAPGSSDALDNIEPSKSQSKINWKKFVTLNPPNLVKFSIITEDLERVRPLPGQPLPAGLTSLKDENQIEIDEVKLEAYVDIVNKSEHFILFKVKTTNIQGYVVKPNADTIPRDCSTRVRVLTQYELASN